MRHLRGNLTFLLLGFICFLTLRVLHENVLSPTFDDTSKSHENHRLENKIKQAVLVHRDKGKKKVEKKTPEKPSNFHFEEPPESESYLEQIPPVYGDRIGLKFYQNYES